MLRTVAALILIVCAGLAARAESWPEPPSGLRGVSLIEGWRQPDGTHVAAIEIRLAPGWHTYWRTPGEAGIPPSFDWSGSANLDGVRYEWPRPLVFDTYGIPTIGYRDELVLPVLLRAARPEAPIEAELELFFGVCDDICVPTGATVRAELTPDEVPEGEARIRAALAERALSAAEAGIERVGCQVAPRDGGFDLTAEVSFAAPPPPGQVAVLESADPRLWIAMPESETHGRSLTAHARVERLEGDGTWLDRGDLRLTLLDADRMVDIRGCGGD